MSQLKVRFLTFGVGLASTIFAQQGMQRQATPLGGGSPDGGKCTVEVVVDIVAQVEIRGNSATLRTMSGQPAQWRRFQCTGPLPANPANFRFAGVDGRGRQSLIRDPRNGGVAVIQIEDKDGGAEGYTFDIFWDNGRQAAPPPPPSYGQDRQGNRPPDQGSYGDRGGNRPPDQRQEADRGGDRRYPEDEYRPGYRDSDYYRRYGHGFTVDEAVRVCQQSIMADATRRFRTQDIHFHRTTIDDQPGRQDWVIGSIDVHRGPREERYGFSCSVSFDNGRVRSAQLDPRPLPDVH